MKNQLKLWPRLKLILAVHLAVVMALAPLGSPVFAASKKKKKTAAAETQDTAVEAAAADKPENPYPPLVIGPGDELEIFVVNFSSGSGNSVAASGEMSMKSQLPTAYLVGSDGMILFPFLGEIRLKDLTQIQASQLLIRRLAEFIKYPQVTVLIRSSNSYNVSVLGEVARPGKFLIRGEPTIFSVLSEAGGPLQDANLAGTLLIRGDGNKKQEVNLDRYLRDKNFLEKPPLVYPGDVLMVPKNGGLSASDWAIIASIVASGAIIATQIK